MIFIWYFVNIFLYSVQYCQWIALYFDPWLRRETAELIRNLGECLFTFTSQPCIPFQPNQKRLNMAPIHIITFFKWSSPSANSWIMECEESILPDWSPPDNPKAGYGLVHIMMMKCKGWLMMILSVMGGLRPASICLSVSSVEGVSLTVMLWEIPAHLRQSLSQWGGGWYRKIGIP